MDADVAAARQARYSSAFEPQAQDLNEEQAGAMEVVSLMRQRLNAENRRRLGQRSALARMPTSVSPSPRLVEPQHETSSSSRLSPIKHGLRSRMMSVMGFLLSLFFNDLSSRFLRWELSYF